ncbi:CopG family transcriptional regulator [Thiocystis violacea]|uniref:type II toxin-antitoxin system RelB family antitoxin n=1 Tax=Thiocystis violacea TaxID=13725 RepID=UPI00190761A1|nr:CopG family transcriptional regulator [Thiocystis violacea]MBK1718519.1 CopG family transcriptional regulator [Thiocystis violacea]
MLAVQIPPALEERLTVVAKAAGRRPDECVIEAVLDYLEDLEDVRLAEERLINLREGRSSTLTLEEVMRDYGMEG